MPHHQGTQQNGPVLVSGQSLTALFATRHDWLLRDMFGQAATTQEIAAQVQPSTGDWPEWIEVIASEDVPQVELPERLRTVAGPDRAILQLAVSNNARLVLIEGKALLEKVKLSFIKSMGVIPLLIQAYQEGRIDRVRPLLTALEKKGHEMPPADQMQALLAALDELA